VDPLANLITLEGFHFKYEVNEPTCRMPFLFGTSRVTRASSLASGIKNLTFPDRRKEYAVRE
jgi:hypothetical protein